MTVTFFDRQDEENLLNGSIPQSGEDLRALLRKPPDRAPFFCELIAENHKNLLIGLGDGTGCVQFSAGYGLPPYFLAVAPGGWDCAGQTEFLLGGKLTPVSNRYRLPMELVLETAAFFLERGALSPDVTWEAL